MIQKHIEFLLLSRIYHSALVVCNQSSCLEFIDLKIAILHGQAKLAYYRLIEEISQTFLMRDSYQTVSSIINAHES